MQKTRRPIPVREWTDQRHVRGFEGERVAMAWYASRGWEVLAHRFRAGRHDVDLIVRRGRLVAFVEVKTRLGSAFGHPAESVGWKKRRAIAWVAEVWRARHGRPDDIYRFDLAVVRARSGRVSEVEAVEDAWRL